LRIADITLVRGGFGNRKETQARLLRKLFANRELNHAKTSKSEQVWLASLTCCEEKINAGTAEEEVPVRCDASELGVYTRLSEALGREISLEISPI
jgi:hypothetical protein